MERDNVFITITPLARRIGLPESWLRSEAAAGRIPFLMVGSRRFFNICQVKAALSERALTARTFGDDQPLGLADATDEVQRDSKD